MCIIPETSHNPANRLPSGRQTIPLFVIETTIDNENLYHHLTPIQLNKEDLDDTISPYIILGKFSPQEDKFMLLLKGTSSNRIIMYTLEEMIASTHEEERLLKDELKTVANLSELTIDEFEGWGQLKRT